LECAISNQDAVLLAMERCARFDLAAPDDQALNIPGRMRREK
jgi:hypothetical protein